MATYKEIDGANYDAGIIAAAEASVAGAKDHFVSAADAQEILKNVLTGDEYVALQQKTIDHILANFRFTDKAKREFLAALKAKGLA